MWSKRYPDYWLAEGEEEPPRLSGSAQPSQEAAEKVLPERLIFRGNKPIPREGE